MSQHLTDGFDGYALFERDKRGKRVPSHMVDEFGRQSGQHAQDFHVRPERAVQLVGEQGLP